MTDQLKKYLLADRRSRVEAVHLSNAWTEGLTHQDLPEPVHGLLGELVAAATLLASNIKFDGSLVLQLQGDGPVALLVVECTADLSIRATATLRDAQAITPDGTLQSLLNVGGEGRFMVVLDPKRSDQHMQPYQGIVPIQEHTIAGCLEHYMRDSEQLDTRLALAADSQHCAGLLMQRLPDQGGTGTDTDNKLESTASDPSVSPMPWEELQLLLDTVDTRELLDTDTDTLIHRLLWEHDVIAFDPQPVQWHCPCTRERVAGMLRMLGEDEVQSILDEQGQISVSCNFCGKPYMFDEIDSAGLFLDPPVDGASDDPTIH